jgi:hypothetical protein
MTDPRPVQTVLSAGLDATAQEAVLSGNAERVLGFGAAARV